MGECNELNKLQIRVALIFIFCMLFGLVYILISSRLYESRNEIYIHKMVLNAKITGLEENLNHKIAVYLDDSAISYIVLSRDFIERFNLAPMDSVAKDSGNNRFLFFRKNKNGQKYSFLAEYYDN